MRVMNLMIVLAVIAIIILAAQYFSQLRKNRNGNNFVSGGRVFFNWTLVAVLVICVGGIIFGSIHSHRQEAKPAQTDKTENVEYAASDSDDLGKVSIQFDRKVTLNDNGEAKVKFKVSPQTTLTIRGHKSKEIVKTFKASKGESLVNHTYTFDVAGTYDIIAERGDQKVTKQLKVKENDNAQESSSSSSSVSYTPPTAPHCPPPGGAGAGCGRAFGRRRAAPARRGAAPPAAPLCRNPSPTSPVRPMSPEGASK